MITMHRDLLKRLLIAISLIVLFQWGIFFLIEMVECIQEPGQLGEEIREILALFVFLSLAPLLMVFATVRILHKVLQPLEELSQRAAHVEPGVTEVIEMADQYQEINSLRRGINQALSRYRKVLEQARRFGGNASHQLRTPLAVVRSGCEVALSRVRSPAEYQAVLGEVLEETAHLQNTIEQLQLLARIECREAALLDTFSIAEFVESLQKRFQGSSETARVHFDIRKGGTGILRANRVLLDQALMNLLDNAMDAAGPEGEVWLRAGTGDQTGVFEVVDSGPGIPEGEREKIFDRFYRGSGAEYEGSGLGLSIATAVAELHNGSLLLDTSAPRTTFRLTLRA